MLLYLDLAYEKWKKEDLLKTETDLHNAVMYGAVKRIRPQDYDGECYSGRLDSDHVQPRAGADVMKRIAAPMVGGVISSTILELIIYPAIYMIWRSRSLGKN